MRKPAIEITPRNSDSFVAAAHRASWLEKTKRVYMKNAIHKTGLFQCILFVLMLLGCASAVDDGTLPAPEEATETTSQALDEATLDANAADCDAGAASADVESGSYGELSSILETASLNDDGSLEATASTCRRVCACCRRGNRFCCSHCRFCSGPIGPYGASNELAR
jgi:hypothetical protein